MKSLLHSVSRYTRFVRSTKLMLALLAAILTGLILFYPLLKKNSSMRVAFTSTESKGSSSPTQMINARFHGIDKENQLFNFTAETATQINADTVNLSQVTGDIELKDRGWLAVSAASGVMHVKDKLLDLKGSIEMFDDEGYELRTELLHVDVGSKNASTPVEVKGRGPLGILKAFGGAHINGNEKTIHFEGPVFVTVYPSQEHTPRRTEKAK